MKKYNTILFDLDGTIADSSEGVTNSVEYALKKYQIEIADKTSLLKFIGPPLKYSFMMYFGFSEEEALKAIEYYREYYVEYGIYQNKIYDGIENLLKLLKENGKKVGLMSSKPEKFAKEILNKSGILKYFDFVCGASMDEKSRTTKIEVMEYGIKENNITDKASTIMIGDRHFDIEGAKYFGFDSIGVLFGFGTREELSDAGATYIAENTKQIIDLLL